MSIESAFPVRYRWVQDAAGDMLQRRRVVLYRVHRQVFEGYEVRFSAPCTGCSYEDGSFEGCHECGGCGRRRRVEWVPFPGVYGPWAKAIDERWQRKMRLLSVLAARKARAVGRPTGVVLRLVRGDGA